MLRYPLVCVECGAVAEDGARGWQAHLADDPRDDEPPEVAVYCPACADREFRPARHPLFD